MLHQFRIRISMAFAVALVSMTPSFAVADDFSPAAGPVTYAKDAAPILYEKCSTCHRPGQIGPMSLLNYEETRPWAKSIKRAVADKTMPPWFADAQHAGQFAGENTLTEDEILILASWVDQGAKMGDPADLPPAPEYKGDGWEIGEPDLVFTMDEFQVTDDMWDYYHHAVVPANFETERWVQASEIKPGDYGVVHHVLVFTLPHGSDMEKERDRTTPLLAGYGPGTDAEILLPGHGKRIPPGHDLLFQVHYHKEPGAGTRTRDASRLAVNWADGPVEHPVTNAWIVNPEIDIPAGAKDYTLKSTFKFIDNGTIFSLNPHMHLRGVSATYVAQYPDGTEETLLHIPKYDFNWQIFYRFKEPKEIPKGTKIRYTAVYDNSADNEANPDPSQRIHWGQETTAEMMIGFMNYKYHTRKKYQKTIGLPEEMIARLLAGGGKGGRGFGDGPPDGEASQKGRPGAH